MPARVEEKSTPCGAATTARPHTGPYTRHRPSALSAPPPYDPTAHQVLSGALAAAHAAALPEGQRLGTKTGPEALPTHRGAGSRRCSLGEGGCSPTALEGELPPLCVAAALLRQLREHSPAHARGVLLVPEQPMGRLQGFAA
eukprot:RCo017105